MELRGLRYLEASKLGDELRELVEELPYLDYKTTTREYYTVFDTYIPLHGRNWPTNPAACAFIASNDRFWLLTRLLGRKDAIDPWLFDRCREVEADEFGYLDLWARYHYKSTITTYAGTIQAILADPEMTVAIFAATNKIARPFLSQIKDELERNDLLLKCFPDVLYENPRQEASSWSLERGITVKRTSNPKEATVEAFGLIDGMPTGRHFKRLNYDDLVTVELVSNPEMIQKVTERWELSDNLGSGEGTQKVHVGTRYDFADTYGVLIQRGSLKPRIYPATDNGRLDGKPVFLSEKQWAHVKNTQRTTAAAQMLQNPTAGKENIFMPDWFRPYEIRPANLNIYIMADPSRGKSATSDRTAIMVVGIDVAGNKYLLDGYRHRMSLTERWKNLRDLYIKWRDMRGVQLLKVGYERYGQQSDDEYFQEKMREPGEVTFELIELSWPREGRESKKARVERLEPDFRQGRFFLPALIREKGPNGAQDCYWTVNMDKATVDRTPMRGMTKSMQAMAAGNEAFRIAKPIWRLDENRNAYDVTLALMEEMLFFPFAPHDDGVDALSRIYDMEPINASPFESERAQTINDTNYADA